MRTPLVSVIVAAHDAERTLSFALSSVLAQTVEDWECVVVDDGSRQSLEHRVRALGDARFRCIRLAENHGRGYARARALEEARGSLLAILDADDWMYPSRLERQIACLQAHPTAALVGCSVLVEDLEHRIVGIHDVPASGRPVRGRFPVSFGTLLIRADSARRIGFDSRLTRAEDVLFLSRALEQPWANVTSLEYVYRPSPPTRKSTLEAHRCARVAYAQDWTRHPLRALRGELAYLARELVHTALSERGSQRLLTWTRSRGLREATDPEMRAHREALAAVRHCEGAGQTPAPNAEDAPRK